MDALTLALGPVFVASFALQQLLEKEQAKARLGESQIRKV